MNPKNILKIEKKFGIEISEMDRRFSISDFHNNNKYFEENGEITEFNISLDDISFLKDFPKLRKLALSGQIDDFSTLETLRYLEQLILEEGDFSDLNLVKNIPLKSLEIKHNAVVDLSPLKDMKSLVKLNFWSNEIIDLQPISSLTNLTHLTFWNNKISDISALSSLENLDTLDLDENEITDLAPLQNLKNLKTLYLSENKIKNVFPLSKINSLSSLWIRGNEGVNISGLNKIPNLTTLDLSDCQLSDFSDLANMQSLVNLHLSGNSISDISFVVGLLSLINLNLGQNNIEDISPLKNLIKIRELLLNDNVITDISILSDLKEIVTLHLANNKIKDLRPIIHLFQKDITINSQQSQLGLKIEGNSLVYPPVQTIRQGNEAILRFFEKINAEGEDTIYEAKITLVGEGSAGKTSLLKRLLDSRAAFPLENNRTRGISIVDWIFKVQKNKKHMAHVWDFGGQDVYYPVHRFFLTENSVFVLLASSRQNTHHFDYWIPTIYQFGGKSPIILGQTCHDGNVTNWNDIGEYASNENFNIIRDQVKYYHELNLPKGNKGLTQIKKSIINQVVNLPHYKKNVPKSWVQVREMIFVMKNKNCISYIDLKDKIINSNSESFKSKEDVEDCIKFFHSIGIVLWYHTEIQLKDWVILNPKWAVDAVYKIIDFKTNSNRGIILPEDFDSAWKAKIYEDKHTILKDMLEVFKIAFPKKNNKGNYIMPTRLQSMEMDNIWKDNDEYLRIDYHYEFMPKGLVNQISAELSRYILNDNEVWNNGVNFYQDQTSSQVFEDFYKRKVIVKSKGNDARGLMMIIMNAIKDITDGYKGVIPKIIIPCTCQKCLIKKDATIFPYEMLLEKLKENKEARVVCNISEEIFRVDSLLHNIGLPNPTKRTKEEADKKDDRTKIKTFKIFLASSSELASERKEFREFISIENDQLHKKGIYFEIIQWENFLDEISNTKLQDEYNKALENCDIALCLFFSKVGKFTEEEFDTAYDKFISSGTPKIWTYFKNAPINSGEIDANINTLLKFKEKLKSLGHFLTSFDSNSNLHLQFKRQLEMFLDDKVN